MDEEIKKILLKSQKDGFEQCIKCIRDMAEATESIDIHNALEALIACLEDLKNGIYGE